MSLLKPGKYFLGLSALLVLASIALIVRPGPQLSIDFTGGTLMELALPAEKTAEDIRTALDAYEAEPPIGNVELSATQKGNVLLRLRDLANEEHIALLEHIKETAGENIEEVQFTTIGPTVGASLKRRAAWALIFAMVAIVLYIAFAFRKVPRRLSPWRFGIIAVATLLHDVLITVGIFILLSHYTTFEFDTLFVTALLTILGYSVNDTIVIFDRIRENIGNQDKKAQFLEVADRSLLESIPRSVNTSISTLVMLLALFLLGSDSIRWFVLTLIIGTIIGTYSSLFLATPLLVYWRKNR